MGFFSSKEDEETWATAHTEVTNAPHKAELSHELISGAAAYEAARAFEKHQEANGKPASHDQAKALVAGFVGAFIDREVETKGRDYIDRTRAKRDAQKQVEEQLATHY